MPDLKGKLLGNKPKAKKTPDGQEKFNLVQYLKDSKEELKKVAWPTRKATWKNTWIVIGFSLVFAAFLGVLDYFFNWGLEFYLTT